MLKVQRRALRVQNKAARVELPIGSKILDFQVDADGDTILFWFLGDDSAEEKVTRKYRIVEPGEVYDFTNRKHCKTIQLRVDQLPVEWCIFEVLD